MKIDVNIGRKDHINVGDFSSVEPTVYLSAKDIDVKNSQEVYKSLSELSGIIMASEFLKSVDEMRHLIKMNEVIKMYAEEIKEHNLDNLFREYMNELRKYDKE